MTVPNKNEEKKDPKKENHAEAASFAKGRCINKPAVLQGFTAFPQ